MRNWNKLTRPWNMRVWIFQFPIDTKIHHKWLEKCYPKDKFNKSKRRVCLICFSMTPFIDYIKFHLWNLNINKLMLINFHISLITKRFLLSFDRHSVKTVTLSELLPNINKLLNKILNFLQKVSRMWLLNCSSYCDTWFNPIIFFKKYPPVNSYRSSSSADRRTESTFLYSLHPATGCNIL